jgi:hypothetical protein
MKKLAIVSVISLFALLVAGGSVFAAMTSGGGYQIWADVISVGGIEQSSSSGGFWLDDTLGEAIVGRSSTTNNNMGAGFQEMVRDNDILSLSISTSTLDLGTLSKTLTKDASHGLTLECNAATGVTVSFSGSTLTSGANYIAGIGGSAASPAIGTSQFGFNATRTSGSVSNSVAPYATAGQYAFSSGDPIISAPIGMGAPEQYTVTYIANISSSQVGGDYSSGIIYTALANF